MLERILSRSAFCSYLISRDTPPVKSNPSVRPLNSIESTEIKIRTEDISTPKLLNFVKGIFIKYLISPLFDNHT